MTENDGDMKQKNAILAVGLLSAGQKARKNYL